MDRSTFRAARAAAAALALALGLSGIARADVYLSLGDSRGLGLGAMPWAASDGTAQGYTPLYAAYLAARDGGALPTVLNLSVAGETVDSFSSGSGRVGPDNQPPTPAEDAVLVALSTNYTAYAAAHGGSFPTQEAMLTQAIAAYGTSIGHVTISLGADDLFKLVLTDPNAVADLPVMLQSFAAHYAAIVMQIRAASPDAQITLVGTYDPYPAGSPGPFAPLAGPAIAALDMTTAMLAEQLHVGFADPSSAFVGHEVDYTYILDNANVHPNALGYSVIAGVIEAVPEPPSFAMMAIGVAGLAWARPMMAIGVAGLAWARPSFRRGKGGS